MISDIIYWIFREGDFCFFEIKIILIGYKFLCTYITDINTNMKNLNNLLLRN